MEARVAANPDDPRAWRMLGRIYEKSGAGPQAVEAFERSVELDPQNAASRFDLGKALLAAGKIKPAAGHLREAVQAAPESNYAAEAQLLLDALPADAAGSAVVQAGFEINRFDGRDIEEESTSLPSFEETDGAGLPRPLSLRLETGLLYNTNVALSPTSRSLAPGTRESFQFYIQPDLEFRFFERDAWSAGVLFLGRFTQNEGNFRDFNLQSVQPGLFVERIAAFDPTVLAARLQYDFTQDAFDGDRFAERHALTGSVSSFWNNGDSTVAYISAANTDFIDDGLFPAFTSNDGTTWTSGVGHTWSPAFSRLKSFGVGVDLEHADLRGDDVRYNGVGLYADAEIPLMPSLSLLLNGGWGYRDYPGFTGAPERNEHIWQAGAKLRKRFNESLSLDLVVDWNRFASENDLFDADRLVTGAVLTWQY